MANRLTDKKSPALIWKSYWSVKRFRIMAVIGTILLLAILIGFPFFFTYIESRQGAWLNDGLLSRIPAMDFSVPIFLIIWLMSAWILIRCIQSPDIFILFLTCFILLTLSRIATITLIPLEPPAGLIPLKDPLTSFFYGGTAIFITKDLFYSGHTSTQFLIFLCLTRKTEKRVALLTSILIGIMVLVQHVHYTIDVLAAFPFTYLIYLLGKKIVRPALNIHAMPGA